MQSFIFNAYTRIYFGEEMFSNLHDEVRKRASNVLLVYGGNSIHNNGVYDKIMSQLQDVNVVELRGVQPNPRIDTVRKGIELCGENDIQAILAVGGGSTIDCAKVIAGGCYYEGDPWDIVMDKSLITKSLPIIAVLTNAATGSEMNGNAVITNTETMEKIGTYSEGFRPVAAFLNPKFTYSLPQKQTVAGVADIMSHTFEAYFKKEPDTFLQDRFAESILRTCIEYCPIAIKEPENYEARANLMWASTWALNGLIGCGKGGAWSCHPMQHELGAFYDIVHGEGLAILTPHWMRYVLNDNTVDKFACYAKNVWGLSGEDKYKLANEAIDKTEEFFASCSLPTRLSQLGIDNSQFDRIAECAIAHSAFDMAYVALEKEDIVNILNNAL